MISEIRASKPKIRFKSFLTEWKERKFLDSIKKIIDFRGRTPRKLGMNWSKSGYLALSALNVKNGYIDFSNDPHYGSKLLYDLWMKGNDLHRGQVVFTTEAPMGNVAQIPDDNKYILSQRTIAFEVDLELITECFLAVLLSSPKVYRRLYSLSSGGTAKGVSQKSLAALDVSFPENTAEQSLIGTYFTEIDSQIRYYQRNLNKLKSLKKAMLKKMFPQKGGNTPEIRFKGFTEPWEKKELNEIASKVTGKNSLKEHSETFTNSAKFGIISQRSFFDKDISNSENIGTYYVVNPEDFVYNPRISTFAPVGPINRNKLGKTGVISPLYTVFSTKNIDNTFLEYFFKTDCWYPFMFYNGDTGARSDRFSIKDIVFFKLPIPYPKIQEQQKIGNYFHQLDKLITKHKTQLYKLKQIKSACLDKMFV